MPCRVATGGYKETKFSWVCKGFGVAHSTDCISRKQNLERGKGRYLHHVSEGGKEKEIA